ncbi:unnamed protein product, partial [Prorocentrum cordatum]
AALGPPGPAGPRGPAAKPRERGAWPELAAAGPPSTPGGASASARSAASSFGAPPAVPPCVSRVPPAWGSLGTPAAAAG